jgi:hypothetical protein
MGKVWVLDTETKGTGANMVPLERVLKKPAASAESLFVPPKPRPRPPEVPKPREPRKFRIVDVMTRQVLVDGAPAREAIDALAGFRSVVDFSAYVWDPDSGRWRMLTLAECRELWKLRNEGPPADSEVAVRGG